MDDVRQRLLRLIPRLAGHRALVVGDLFLDEYLVGRASRLSREAPIPVLEFTRQFNLPGGAANPAQNICALGAEATVVGLVGSDEAGAQLLSLLRSVGIDPSGVVVDAVLVSDYQSGVATKAIVQATERRAHAQGKICTVDAQGSFRKYQGFELVKGNRQEMEAFLSCQLQDEKDYERAGEQLLSELSARAAIITRGAEGLSLVSRHEGYRHLPAANRSEVFDVTGAGDTVIAVATLALTAGASFIDAARLANLAAGWVVRKQGNAVASAEELAWAVENWQA